MSTPWTRRSVLALGLGAPLTLLRRADPARAATVDVDGLVFTTPALVRAVPRDGTLGTGWQWQGRSSAADTATVVLARADLAVGHADEVLGLVLAGALAGRLPDLRVRGRRRRAMPGGGEQTRVALTWQAGAGRPRIGSLLVAVRPDGPAGLLAVVGGAALTAGTVDGVLDSARWT